MVVGYVRSEGCNNLLGGHKFFDIELRKVSVLDYLPAWPGARIVIVG